MRVYRWSSKIKMTLLACAIVIAVVSLLYTDYLVDQLRAREQSLVHLWADAQAYVAEAQAERGDRYVDDLRALNERLRSVQAGEPLVLGPEIDRYRQAVTWAQGRSSSNDLNFITNNILIPNPFGIPAIITDSTMQQPLFWRNVSVPDTLSALSEEDSARAVERLQERRAQMDEVYTPIQIEFGGNGEAAIRQYVHYDESSLIRQLRWFPYIQLLFVALLIIVGYVGLSYIQKSEQSSLWAGMAREAAHQLGTPISSLMGWTQLLRSGELDEQTRKEALNEVDKDIARLQRVANRFSDIGSMPKLQVQQLKPVVEDTVAYIGRRVPRESSPVSISVNVPDALYAPINAELFEWVIENLLKNALDALEANSGQIWIEGKLEDDTCCIEVTDTGRGIERSQVKNIFRPGYSTKKRGWGLGLSLAQRIIEHYHGGKLELAQSKVGEGSTFRIELPAASPVEDERVRDEMRATRPA